MKKTLTEKRNSKKEKTISIKEKSISHKKNNINKIIDENNINKIIDENDINEIIDENSKIYNEISVRKLIKRLNWIKNNTTYHSFQIIINKFNEIYNEKMSANIISSINKLCRDEKFKEANEKLELNINNKRRNLFYKFINTIYFKYKLETMEFIERKFNEFKIECKKQLIENLKKLEIEISL